MSVTTVSPGKTWDENRALMDLNLDTSLPQKCFTISRAATPYEHKPCRMGLSKPDHNNTASEGRYCHGEDRCAWGVNEYEEYDYECEYENDNEHKHENENENENENDNENENENENENDNDKPVLAPPMAAIAGSACRGLLSPFSLYSSAWLDDVL